MIKDKRILWGCAAATLAASLVLVTTKPNTSKDVAPATVLKSTPSKKEVVVTPKKEYKERIYKVTNHQTGEVFEIGEEEYVSRVLSKELYKDFHLEAYKAMAVAIRSYSRYRLDNNQGLSTDHNVCQAYSFDEPREIAVKAANETRGQVMTYLGKPILAMYFSTSAGKTEDVKNVYSGDYPYLKSVDSPYDKEAPKAEATVSFSYDELHSKLGTVKIIVKERSAAGTVLKAQVGSKEMTGREVRTALGLNSSNFKLTYHDSSLDITTKGLGHGVGLAQYGAHFLGQKGKKYTDILNIYYSGIVLSEIM